MRWNQWKRTTLSLALVLATYWVYSSVVVPYVEPPLVASQQPSQPSPANAPRVTERFQAELTGLFPADAWENRSPKVLRHKTTLVLFQDYQPRDDGTIRVHPCTVVFRRPPGSSPSGGKEPDASSILIMQAPEGAVLQLERPIDSQSLQLGQPVKGHLQGPIRITCRGDENGKGRLQILSSDVRINEQRLWTPNEVDFQFETSRARGRDLMIKLMPSGSDADPSAPQGWAGIRSIELIHLDQLHLEVREQGQSNAANASSSTSASSAPVDVACKGPLQIKFLENLMTFEDDVRLRRTDPSGSIDTLACERLSLYISQAKSGEDPPPEAPPADGSASKNSLPKLELERVVAEGNPVVLDATSRRARIRGRKLQYDLKHGRYRVESDVDTPTDQVWFQHEQHEITARELDCQFSSPRVLSRLRAVGPGHFTSQMKGSPPQPLDARWEQILLLEREQDLYRLTLAQAADVQLADQHRIQAHMLYLWLKPQEIDRRTKDTDTFRFQPHKLVALANPKRPQEEPVRMYSDGTTAVTQRLDTVFRPAARASSSARSATRPVTARSQDRSQPTRLNPTPSETSITSSQSTESSGRSRSPQLVTPRRRTGAESRVTSEQMHIVLQQNETGMELVDLALLNRVRVSQQSDTDSPDPSFELRADRVTMKQTADPANPILVADGEIVEIWSPQMLLQTTQVQLDRASNLFSSERPGQMQLQIDRDASGQRLAKPQEMTVVWQDHMDFDGRFVRFGGEVQVQSPDQQMRADLLEIRLNREVRFNGSRTSKTPLEIEQILANGDVIIRSEQRENGELISRTKLQVPFATLHRITGEIRAGGPGQLVTVRDGFRGNLSLTGGAEGGRSGAREERVSDDGRAPLLPRIRDSRRPPEPDEKTYLQVDYNGSIEGNLNERIVHFQEHVRVIYGPVRSWNESLQPRGALRDNDVLLSCQRLTVAQGVQLIAGRPSFDLQAQGNTIVEGKTFTARGERVSFEQAKDLLVLEGSERADAVLSHQARVGAPRLEQVARKIFYRPSTGDATVEDARYSDLGNLGL